MSVINNHCSCGTHTHTSIRGIILLVLNFLEDVCLLFFVAFPFFLRGGGVCTQASFLCSSSRQATKERSEQQKWLLQLAGLFCTIPHCLITWKQLPRNNYVSKGLFFLEVALLFDPLAIFHG